MSTIIRKPKFMRNDEAMNAYIDIAAMLSKEAYRSDVTMERKIILMNEANECLIKGAKAGGFLNVGDMRKWLSAP